MNRFCHFNKGKAPFGLIAMVIILIVVLAQFANTYVIEKKNTIEKLEVAFEKEISLLDSSRSYNMKEIEILSHLNEGLFRYNANGKVEKVIAESYTVSKDGLTWTFIISKDSKWSNKEKVTAFDFEYSIKRSLKYGIDAPFNVYIEMASIKNVGSFLNGESTLDDVGVYALDEDTLIMELTEPIPYFENLLTFPVFFPLNESFCENEGNEYGTSIDKLLSNGPYKVTYWEPQVGLILEKNKEYYATDEVFVNMISYKNLTLYNDKNELLDKDEYYVYPLDYLNGSTVNTSKVKFFDKNSVVGIKLQKQGDLLKNINVRKAISYAVDNKKIVSSTGNTSLTAANYLIPYNFSDNNGADFRDNSCSSEGYNQKKAKEHWKLAKKELKFDEASIALVVDNMYLNVDDLAKLVKEQLMANLDGLNIRIYIDPFSSKISELRPTYEKDALVLTTLTGATLDPLAYIEMFGSNDSLNNSGYSNRQLDELIEKCKQSEIILDQKKRWQLLKESESIILNEEVIYFPLWQQRYSMVLSDGIDGLVHDPFNPIMIYLDMYETNN